MLLIRILIFLFALLCSIENGDAGLTSSFIRTQWPSVDIPLDHEVFAVPDGYNAPQQVSLLEEVHSLQFYFLNSFLFLFHSH